jgi:hypothetical protein
MSDFLSFLEGKIGPRKRRKRREEQNEEATRSESD